MPRYFEDTNPEGDVESNDSGGKAKGQLPTIPVNNRVVVAAEAWVRGDPGPYGLLCFGMTTCMLMFITTGWAEKHFLPTVFCYAMFYGGFGQFVAGTLELIKGNTFGGTAFASYGSFWMGWFLLEYLTISDKARYPLAATGKTLWCGLWAFLTAGFFVVTCRKNGCLMTIFSTLVITFSLLAGGVWNERCAKAAGYFGFFCGSSAIYAAFAFLYDTELGIKLPGVHPVQYI
ncbi:hypothetical protein PLESTB_000367600 [Pleodorina starrii]|uniref:GPR1/FUN34/yaaH family protein n=1 Tax=Pleodorina starrii TaxID=330485 RepID=A0A9W6BDU7_9CHLO|nr:hypothetical protein PLESTM_000027300 [Pleodorina starrii]GLC50334.1 hypothetical protein PLESTB_000367600 [Pleodorina starrii]GLC64284.1 hypothetical protein PLESTF_000145200 [Pleodorina starrii]